MVDGTAPPFLVDWVARGYEARTDVYTYAAAATSSKLRGGTSGESKLLRASAAWSDGGLCGVAELWHKQPGLLDGGLRVEVGKRRRKRGGLEVVLLSLPDGTDAWSVAVRPGRPGAVRRLAEFKLAETFDVTASCSYPLWLAQRSGAGRLTRAGQRSERSAASAASSASSSVS